MFGTVICLLFVSCVIAYTDIRDTPCMSSYLTQKIPANRAIWKGSIDMKMTCNQNYDYPLNIPYKAMFRCKPDGKSWNPSYVPDCNKLQVPSEVIVVIALHMTKSFCQGATKDNLAPFNNQATMTSTCDGVGLENCAVRDVLPVCDGYIAEPREDEQFWINELKDGSEPFVAVLVRADYSHTTHGDEMIERADKLALAVKDLATNVNKVNERLKAPCLPGSLGVSLNNGGLRCRGCSLGHYLDMEAKQCKQCEAGKYSDVPLALQCKTCPALFGITSQNTWDEIARKFKKGSYSLIYCPSIDKHGNLVAPYAELGKPRQMPNTTRINTGGGTENAGSELRRLPVGWPVLVLVYLVIHLVC